MKRYLFILIALAFMGCKETIFVGGTVTDYLTNDSIEGMEIGLYKFKPNFSYQNKKWSEMELIATAITNSDGFFSMEIDADIDMSNKVAYYPVPTQDTLSVNSQYTPDYSLESSFNSQYGTNGRFRFYRSSNIQINLINFTQKEVVVKYGNLSSTIYNLTYSTELKYSRPLTGKNQKFDFYSEDGTYLGRTSRYLRTQLPEDSDQVEWFMPIQIIEIDYKTLVKE